MNWIYVPLKILFLSCKIITLGNLYFYLPINGNFMLDNVIFFRSNVITFITHKWAELTFFFRFAFMNVEFTHSSHYKQGCGSEPEPGTGTARNREILLNPNPNPEPRKIFLPKPNPNPELVKVFALHSLVIRTNWAEMPN